MLNGEVRHQKEKLDNCKSQSQIVLNILLFSPFSPYFSFIIFLITRVVYIKVSRTALEQIRKNHFGDGRFRSALKAKESYATNTGKSRKLVDFLRPAKIRQTFWDREVYGTNPKEKDATKSVGFGRRGPPPPA
jgi:hypothetical protein